MALNFIIIHGRLTRDPELRQTASGIEVCNFTVAVDRPKNKEGERITDFFACAAYRERAQLIANHFSKGKEIIVTGRMQSRRFTDRDNVERTAWELTVDSFDFCGSKNEAGVSVPGADVTAAPSYMPDRYKATPVPAPKLDELSDEDDLPF